MIKLVKSSEVHQDETANYDVLLDKEYTVREFVEEILEKRKKEWGRIYLNNSMEINNPYCEYQHGKLIKSFPNNILDRIIIVAKAKGGWTLMDYVLITYEKMEKK